MLIGQVVGIWILVRDVSCECVYAHACYSVLVEKHMSDGENDCKTAEEGMLSKSFGFSA